MTTPSSRGAARVRPRVLLALLVTGCECDPERPYTPFPVVSKASTTSSAPPSPTGSAPVEASEFARQKAVLAPRNSKEWSLEGMTLRAPEGRLFERGLAADFDGDDQLEALAWTIPEGNRPDAVPGELYLFDGDQRRRVGSTPPFVPTGPGCTLTTELSRTGPRTATLDVAAQCDKPLVARSPVRGVTVIAPSAERPEVLSLRLAEPAPGETMALGIDSSDRDGDERDDVRVEVTMLAEGTSREATAQLIWLDRATGPARTPTEPTQSLTDIGSVEVVRAEGKNTAEQVHERVENARRLYAALCAESATPRVFDRDGAALPCAGLERAFEWFVTADVKSALTRNDVISAFGVLDRAGWYGSVSGKVVAKLEGEVLSKVTLRQVESRTVAPVPRLRAGIPRWSPLWFEANGSLLIQAVASIERVGSSGETIGSADDEVDPWPSTVADGEGNRLWGVGLPCDRSEVSLLRTGPRGRALPPVSTGLLAPRPGACGREPGPTVELPVPIEWTSQRQVAIVAGHVMGKAPAFSDTPQPGSPRSPDGKRLVVVTTRGLLVAGGERPELWQVEGGTSGYTDCVVANGGKAVACVKDARARLLTPR